MMNLSDSNLLVVLLLANAVLLVTAVIAIYRLQAVCRRLDPLCSSLPRATNATRKPDLERQQLLTVMRLERQVSELYKYLRTSAARDRGPVSMPERSMPIDNAMRMARSGASIEDLTRSCGLNIGEARLMHKIHSKPDPVAAD